MKKLDDESTIWMSIEHLLKAINGLNKRIKILEVKNAKKRTKVLRRERKKEI